MSGKETSGGGCSLAARIQTKSLTGNALAPLGSELDVGQRSFWCARSTVRTDFLEGSG